MGIGTGLVMIEFDWIGIEAGFLGWIAQVGLNWIGLLGLGRT